MYCGLIEINHYLINQQERNKKVKKPKHNVGIQSHPKEHKSTKVELDYSGCKGKNHHLPHGNCRGHFPVSDKNGTQPDMQGSTLMKQGILTFGKVQRQHIN